MMHLETERMLAQHLMNVANHEKHMEQLRIELNEHYRFQPNSAFKRMDRLNNKKINAYDLATFLRDNGYNYYSPDLNEVVQAFDADGDGHLDQNEFIRVILTATDTVLQKRAYERYEEYVGFRDYLAKDIERGISRILAHEIEGLKFLNKEKETLKQRYDFSRLDAFRAIDHYKLNSLLRDDIKTFLNRNGLYATTLDADNLFRRLDLDGDGRITYTEFCDYLEKSGVPNHINIEQEIPQQKSAKVREYQTPERRNQPIEVIKVHDQKAQTEKKKSNRLMMTPQPRQEDQVDDQSKEEIEKNYIMYGVREKHATPLKRSKSAQSTLNSGSAKKQGTRYDNSEDKLASMQTTPSPTKDQRYHSPDQKLSSGQKQLEPRHLNLDDIEEDQNEYRGSFAESQENDAYQSNEFSSSKKKAHSLSKLEEDEEEKLSDTLKSMIALEMDNEKAKQKLALKADFNLLDAFRLFDKYGLGEINKFDFEEALQKLGIYAVTKREIDLFFKRYDSNCDFKIRYLEFSEALTPNDRIYSDHLLSKRPNYDAKSPDEAISLKTKLAFGDTLRVLIKSEAYNEEMRIKLSQLPRFSISAAFQTLDSNNNGFLSKPELKNFLEDHDFFATNKEIDMLFAKMDRDRDDKITYGEFFGEMAPKVPY